jgi:cytochrome c oxidase subunit 2
MKLKWVGRVVCVALLSAGMFADGHPAAQSAPRRIEVTASKFKFTPGELTLKKGDPVVLVLKSSDATHGLRFRDLNLDIKIPKGGPTELKFIPDKTGDFVGHCSVFCGEGHGAMTLTLHVVE